MIMYVPVNFILYFSERLLRLHYIEWNKYDDIVSLYDNGFQTPWDTRFSEKLAFEGFDTDVTEGVKDPTYYNVMQTVLKFADGVTVGSEVLDENSAKLFEEAACIKLSYSPEEQQVKALSEFFDRVIEDEVLA